MKLLFSLLIAAATSFILLGVIPFILLDRDSKAPPIEIPLAKDIDEIRVYGDRKAYQFSITDPKAIEDILHVFEDWNAKCCRYPLGNTPPLLPYNLSFQKEGDVKLYIHIGRGGYGSSSGKALYRGRSYSKEEAQRLKRAIPIDI